MKRGPTKSKSMEFDYKNFEEGINKLREGNGFLGPEGALTGLIKHLLEVGLNSELGSTFRIGRRTRESKKWAYE